MPSCSRCRRSCRAHGPTARRAGRRSCSATLTDQIVEVEPEEAELAKLFTNTWRYIKFAAANQFFMIANDFGLDFERIRDAIDPRLPACGRPARRRVRRRAVPVQGHDAARRVQQQQLPARPREHAGQRRACRCTSCHRLEKRFDLADDDGRHPRHGVQGRVRRHPVEPVVQAQAHPAVQGRARCCAPTRTSPSTPTSLPLDEVLERADLLIIGAPARGVPRPDDRQAGRRHLEPARRRRAGVSAPRLGRHPRLQRGRRDRSPCLDRSSKPCTLPCEVLVVYDARGHDRAVPRASTRERTATACPTLNTYGRGPGQRDPVRHRCTPPRRSSWSPWPTAATTPMQIDDAGPAGRARRRGRRRRPATCRGGQQVGGPCLKRLLSRMAGRRLLLVRPGRHPRRDQLVQGLLDRSSCARSASRATTASRSASSWSPRRAGTGCPSPRSRPSGSTATFGAVELQVVAWLPRYLHWYLFAFGRRLPLERSVSSRPARPRPGGTIPS